MEVAHERMYWRRKTPPARPGRMNVGKAERVGSAVAGAAALALGLTRRGPVRPILAALGGLGLLRAATGHSLIYTAMGVSSASLEEGAGIRIEENVTIAAPREEVFARWSDLTRLPQYLSFVRSVDRLEPGVTHWVIELPRGVKAEWDAEIIDRRENELLAWHSRPGSQIEHAGSVRFMDVPGRGTEMQLKLRFVPPGGIAGFAAARMLRALEERGVAQELRRFKAIVEAGEAPTTEGQPSGRRETRERAAVSTAPTMGGDELGGHIEEA